MKMAGLAQGLSHRDPSHARDSLLRLGKLRREGFLCDLTILVQGQKFKAHKAVMAACSDYFLEAICGGKSSPAVSISKGPDGDHMTIELQYVTLRGFTPLLEYAYSSDLHVNAADVIDVLSAASYMQMFNVAGACSEFMRSNLLWSQSQSRLPNLPLVGGGRPLLANGQNHSDHGLGNNRGNALPEAVQNLLQGSRPNPLAQPPMLIPISSMTPYDVGLQQWVDTVAGTQTLLSRFVNGQSAPSTQSPASSMSPPSSPRASPGNDWSGDLHAARKSSRDSAEEQSKPDEGESSPARRETDRESPLKNGFDGQHMPASDVVKSNINSNNNNNNTNNNNNNNSSSSIGRVDSATGLEVVKEKSQGSRKSMAVKVETTTDDESHSTGNEDLINKNNGSPSQCDSEDSWQSLQRLYSFQNKGNSASAVGSSDASAPSTVPQSLVDTFASNPRSPNVASRLPATANSLQSVLEKINGSMSRLESPVSMVPRLNGMSMHTALLQRQQQLLTSQQPAKSTEEGEKLVADLPAVPPGGQYMSVRRRTLQSNVPKPHQCQICGSRFTRFHNLKQHIKLHSGIKPFECDECGKRFTRNYTLRLHKMKHVGMRNFKCGTCDASFTSLGEFRAHLRITMHSHLPVGSSGSPQTQARMMEPEDLSGAHMSPSLLKFDSSMLRYGAGSPGSSGGGAAEGSTGTISPPTMANSSLMASYFGSESPHLSDRSMTGSPQDLTTKRPYSDGEDKGLADGAEMDVNAGAQDETAGKRVKLSDEESQAEEKPMPEIKQERAAASPKEYSEDEPMSLVMDTSTIEASEN